MQRDAMEPAACVQKWKRRRKGGLVRAGPSGHEGACHEISSGRQPLAFLLERSLDFILITGSNHCRSLVWQ